VFEGLCGGDPLGRVDCEHGVDKVLCLGGHRVPLRGWVLKWRGGILGDCEYYSKIGWINYRGLGIVTVRTCRI